MTGIVDSTGDVLAGKLAAQGGANDVNTQFQFAGYDSIVGSTRALLDVPTTFKASGLFFETGTVGVIPWVPKQNRKSLNPEAALSYNGDYGSFSVPELGTVGYSLVRTKSRL